MAKLPIPSSVNDTNFEVEITLKVTKGNRPFSETTQRYVNMDYVQMQTTQGLCIKALVDALVGAGDAVVAEITAAAEE